MFSALSPDHPAFGTIVCRMAVFLVGVLGLVVAVLEAERVRLDAGDPRRAVLAEQIAAVRLARCRLMGIGADAIDAVLVWCPVPWRLIHTLRLGKGGVRPGMARGAFRRVGLGLGVYGRGRPPRRVRPPDRTGQRIGDEREPPGGGVADCTQPRGGGLRGSG